LFAIANPVPGEVRACVSHRLFCHSSSLPAHDGAAKRGDWHRRDRMAAENFVPASESEHCPAGSHRFRSTTGRNFLIHPQMTQILQIEAHLFKLRAESSRQTKSNLWIEIQVRRETGWPQRISFRLGKANIALKAPTDSDPPPMEKSVVALNRWEISNPDDGQHPLNASGVQWLPNDLNVLLSPFCCRSCFRKRTLS
jgi:hypothetical protein